MSVLATTRRPLGPEPWARDERNAQLVNAAPNRPDLWIEQSSWYSVD